MPSAKVAEQFEVYAEGVFCASVCSSLGLRETEIRMAQRASGTEPRGWRLSEDKEFRTGQKNPCPCNEKPETHMHYLFDA